MPAEAPTIANALKAMGYATGQFGKNHLGAQRKPKWLVDVSTASAWCAAGRYRRQ
jgi:arylsulfatase A-like enzyme